MPLPSRTPGRHHLGTVGGIKSEWRAPSNRNRGRDHPGIRMSFSIGRTVFELIAYPGNHDMDWRAAQAPAQKGAQADLRQRRSKTNYDITHGNYEHIFEDASSCGT
jgi:hypothetical protein